MAHVAAVDLGGTKIAAPQVAIVVSTLQGDANLLGVARLALA